jgi:hypothetical protein
VIAALIVLAALGGSVVGLAAGLWLLLRGDA